MIELIRTLALVYLMGYAIVEYLIPWLRSTLTPTKRPQWTINRTGGVHDCRTGLDYHCASHALAVGMQRRCIADSKDLQNERQWMRAVSIHGTTVRLSPQDGWDWETGYSKPDSTGFPN